MTPTTAQTDDQTLSHSDLMYEGLGHVLRALHDALTFVGADGAVATASNEFPSARERLIHIATLTENAANTVLNRVDETMPMQRAIGVAAVDLEKELAGVPLESLTREALIAMVTKSKAFVTTAKATSESTHQALSDIMMAQDFQDLTGQLIKKVATLLENTETDLLKLLVSGAPAGKVASLKVQEELAGPGAIGSVVMAQDDVDAMLAELGF